MFPEGKAGVGADVGGAGSSGTRADDSSRARAWGGFRVICAGTCRPHCEELLFETFDALMPRARCCCKSLRLCCSRSRVAVRYAPVNKELARVNMIYAPYWTMQRCSPLLDTEAASNIGLLPIGLADALS